MAKLTFFGGVGEIGGNKVLLEDRGTKVFLDFGKNFEKERLYFDEPFLSPRDEKHLLALGILPPIQGLYKKEAGVPEIDAIIISHPHTDHMDYIRYIKDEVPIYCGETTRTVVLAREFSGRAKSIDYGIAKITKTEGVRINKSFSTFRTGDRIGIGSLELGPIHVDHSTPGSYGFIIHTSAGHIVYTGDFRLHGARSEMTQEFVERAKKARPKALIIEGTNIVNARVVSEEEVRAKVHLIVSKTPHLVMAGFSPVDVDRLRTFYSVAIENGRKLAISMKQAVLVGLLQEDKGIELFSLDDPNILVFRREKKTEAEWEKLIPQTPITATDVMEMQDELILVASFYDMNEAIEINPGAGSVYILSESEPFNEEMETDFEKLLNWLEHLGIPLYNIHASGHANPHELKWVIGEIRPEKVYLIHTDRPFLYQRFVQDLGIREIVCPELGREYHL